MGFCEFNQIRLTWKRTLSAYLTCSVCSHLLLFYSCICLTGIGFDSIIYIIQKEEEEYMEKAKKKPNFTSPYDLNGRIPLRQAVPLGLQHV